ncbi:hypothetical protein [Thiosocius teredinicola]|uniref:hypothetical protein n=1 Tax=Thiosocius teredinicola TaxID=1973002 RepID=UPI000990C053
MTAGDSPPDDIYASVEALSAEGNDLLDDDDPAGAVARWQAALALLPEPRAIWDGRTTGSIRCFGPIWPRVSRSSRISDWTT